MSQASNGKLDSWDRVILRVLQEDADASIESMALRLGMAGASVSSQVLSQIEARVKKLEEQKAILARVAILDRSALGFSTLILAAVRLETHSRQALTAFEEGVARCPEILECYSIMAEDDYILKIVLRSPEDYQYLLKQHLLTFSPVAEVRATVVVSTIKSTTSLPI